MEAVKRNWLKRGDKVEMKDGGILTVMFLEDRHFIAEEKVGYIKKSDIKHILED